MYFKRIYDLRVDNDLTQQQVAKFLVCNRQVYARYERGIREIPVSMLTICKIKNRLEGLLNASVDVITLPLPEDSIIEINKVVSLYAA